MCMSHAQLSLFLVEIQIFDRERSDLELYSFLEWRCGKVG